MKLKAPEHFTPDQKMEYYEVWENTKHYQYGARGGWEKEKRNPILSEQYGVIFDVSIMKEDGLYKMWLSWRTRKGLGYSESRDGLHWSEPVSILDPVPGSDWEADELSRPSVLKKNGKYLMWYCGSIKPYMEDGTTLIGMAESEDGLHWTRLNGGRPLFGFTQEWEDHAVMCPHVVYEEENGLFKMWYSGGNNHEPVAIGYAVSRDGLHWEKYVQNPVLTPDPAYIWEQHKVCGCHVMKDKDWYYMFYIGHLHEERAQVGLARSRDGITGWEKHPENPIIAPDAGSWDGLSVYKPYVLKDGDRWVMWYNGACYDEKIWCVEQIGLAYHEGDDLGF